MNTKFSHYFLPLMLCFGMLGHAQSDSVVKSKLYFNEAQKQFEQKQFKDALFFIEKTEETLGSTTGRILSLKIKTYNELKNFEKALETFRIFEKDYVQRVSEELKAKTLSYYPKIVQGAAEFKEKKAEANVEADKLHETFTYFRYEDCWRCNGMGEYSTTRNKKGRQKWWKKEKCKTCEVCKGKAKLLYFYGNDSILGTTQKKFIDAHGAEIIKSLNTKDVQE